MTQQTAVPGLLAAFRAERGILTVLSVLTMLVGLLLPVVAAGLEAHAGNSIDHSFCRAPTPAHTGGDGGPGKPLPVAGGQFCICPAICGLFCGGATGLPASSLVPDAHLQTVATPFSATSLPEYFRSALRPDVRGPPTFT